MKNVQISGSSPKMRSTVYYGFKGVDMSTDALNIDKNHASFCPNMISDSGGNPEKRPGWRTLHVIQSPVNGIYSTVIDKQTYYIAHGGTKLYKWALDADEAPTVLHEGVNNGRSTAFSLNGKLWILTGNEYLCYDGEQVKNVSSIAYIPTTVIARSPNADGEVSDGEVYEAANLLTPKRRNKFLADGTATVYQLDSAPIDNVPIIVKVNDSVKTAGTDYTVNYTTGQVTFKTAPPKPSVTGQDNVEIEFSKTTEGYAQRIEHCTISTLYGLGTNDRVFMSGNPDFPATDWHSNINDPSYMPDINYSQVGTEATAIMGYSKIGEYLAIVKEDNLQDSTIFLRSAKMESTEDETKAVFPLKQGVAGVGAISKYAFANLIDEPLFLSRTGVYGIVSSTITAERTLQNRSYYIDAQLTKEKDLQNAVAVQWQGFYLIAMNGRCYILDGKQDKSYKPQSNGDYVYECYHWENIPAVCFLEYAGDLFFGTSDGRICRFNTDIETMSRYNDDGQAIPCYWATVADCDGAIGVYKTMTKRGNTVTIKPYTRSSARITARTEHDAGKQLRYDTMDILDWNDIDFNRFTFNTLDSPQTIAFNAKVKRYKTLQLIIGNDAVNEGFGLYRIEKSYTVGNYVK